MAVKTEKRALTQEETEERLQRCVLAFLVVSSRSRDSHPPAQYRSGE